MKPTFLIDEFKKKGAHHSLGGNTSLIEQDTNWWMYYI